MSDHVSFLASVPPPVKTALTETSDRAGLAHLAGHAGLILMPGTLIAIQVPFWGLLVPLQGIALIFLFTLEHECNHCTPFHSARPNDWVGRTSGFLILLPFTWFRAFHLAHHRFTNNPGKDPELKARKPETFMAWLTHVSGLPVWRVNIALILRLAAGRERARYLSDRALPRMEHEARGCWCSMRLPQGC